MADTDFPPRPRCDTAEVCRSDGGHSREFVDGGRRRLEAYGPDGRLSFAAIYRHDLGLCWSLIPLTEAWAEAPLAQLEASPLAQSLGSMVRWVAAGPVVFGGINCLRFDVGLAREECLVESATGVPLRHATYNRLGEEAVVWSRTSLELAPPDPLLFEPPARPPRPIA